MTIQDIVAICMSFPEVTESPHFEKTSFRVGNKIFATLKNDDGLLVVKLSELDQSVFVDIGSGNITPVPGSWGRKGWTQVFIQEIESRDLCYDLAKTAYKEVAPKKLIKLME